MTQEDIKLYREAKKTGDTDLLLVEKLDKTIKTLEAVAEEVKKKSESEVVIEIDREELVGEKGEPGDTPTDGELLALITPLIPAAIPGKPGERGKDGGAPTEKELLALIRPLIPKVKDGDTPSDARLLKLIRPLIPKVKDGEPGKDGSPDTPDEVVAKVNASKKFIEAKRIKGLPKFVSEKIIGASGGPRLFTSLADAPDSYIGEGSKVVSVKADETGLEFTTGGGGGSGTVTSVSVVTANGLSGTVVNPTTTPAITLDISALDAAKIADGSVSNTEFQYLDGVTSDIQTQLNSKQATGNYITALTGDVTATGPGSVGATLATVNANVGSFTNATITVNAKGLITAASSGSVTDSFARIFAFMGS